MKQYEITLKRELNDEITLIHVYAPPIAKKALAGQFIILRVDERGERIPLTIAGVNPDQTITLIFQKMGATTLALGALKAGDALRDLVGPLGQPTHIADMQKVAVVGGGLGCAIAYPVAKALHDAGAQVDLIAGFRTKELIILEEEMQAASTRLHLCTDDGSYGTKGFVTDKLRGLIDGGAAFDHVFAIGPLVMMKFVSALTKTYALPTTISMNPIMVDGTGMCGCCRVTVGGEVRFACVDGPDFDGHQVDFDEIMSRNTAYAAFEAERKQAHLCRLRGEIHG